MKERLPRVATYVAAAAMGTALLEGCTIGIDTTSTETVHCDGTRTIAKLDNGDETAFTVQGKAKEDIATIYVKRFDDLVAVKVSGDVTGPLQELDTDGYTEPIDAPTDKSDDTHLNAFGAGGAWFLDVGQDTVAIEGTCFGL